jgi:flagellar basal-body rod protein FlgB
LHRALDRAALNTAVVASNLANVDTPGYRALEARFAELIGSLRPGQEIARTDPRHAGPELAPDTPALIVEAEPRGVRADGNTVDVDHEMTRLAALRGRFEVAAQLVRKRFALLRYAATDGRSQG